VKSISTIPYAGNSLSDVDDAQIMYAYLGPRKFFSDHVVYSILPLIYARLLFLFVMIYYMLYGWSGLFEPPFDGTQHLLQASILVSICIGYFSIPRFLTTKSKGYPYFLAKSQVDFNDKAPDNIARLRQIFNALEAYNVFLQRNFKIKIKDLCSFYSNVASDTIGSQIEVTNRIYQSFHTDGSCVDQLTPLREIKKTIETAYKKDFVTGFSTRGKIENWISASGLAISLIVALLPFLIHLNHN
jgi:hypothetical protein